MQIGLKFAVQRCRDFITDVCKVVQRARKRRSSLVLSVRTVFLAVVAVSSVYDSASWAQGPEPLTGSQPDGQIIFLPDPKLLDNSCVVSILNRTVSTGPDGSWVLPTVPANFGPVRARATCVRNGVSIFGQSDLFTLAPNQTINLPHIVLGNTTPIPSLISVSSPLSALSQAGQTVQLSVSAQYQGGTSQDITPSSAGTQYQVSNPAIAMINADGLVTAVSSGNVLVQALNEGAQGILSLQVNLGGANNGGIPNSWILSNFCPNFSQGVPCPQLTDPSFASEDPDHDGLTNLQEFQNGTDPNNPDTDGDGLTDGQELLTYHTNPLLASSDGTGIPDGIEVQTNTLGGSFSAKLAAALKSITVAPTSFTLTVNTLSDVAAQQLAVTGSLIDGKTKLDLTSTQKGTTYSSSDLTVCNFGAPDGNIFAGNPGPCTITVKNSGFTATATGQVAGFTPTPLGFAVIPGFANGVAVNGNHAYVAAGSAGLQIVDVTNRNAPVVVSSVALKGNANSVRLLGNLAVVAAGSAGLYTVDVTNPTAPAVLQNLSTGGNALDVNVQGSIAYVANSTNLELVNVANPAVMNQISSLTLTGLIRGVSVDPQRGIAAVAADTNGIYLVDVSNPAAPALLSQLSVGNAHQVAIKGSFVFVADYHTVSAPYQNSLASVDISNPSVPVVRSTITNQSFGGNLNDLALSGNLALGADVVFVNGIPITDISDPTNLLSRAILNFPQRDDNGMGIAVDGTYVYLATDQSAIEKFGISGNGRLYIGQYQNLQDTFGIPPVVSIASPLTGVTVVQGSTIAVSVNATDDVGVAAVNLLANGQPVLTNTVAPYVFFYTVPAGISTLTFGATAVDFGGNVGTASNVTVSVIPDPGTTVIGRVVDGNKTPLSGFVVQTIGHSAITGTDGTFTIPNLPTVSVGSSGVTVTTHGVAAGVVRAGTSSTVAAVLGGITNVGDIVTISRPFVIVDGNSGTISALDTSQTPPVLVPTTGGFGSAADGASVLPDGSKSFSSVGGVIRTFDLTVNPPVFNGDIILSTIGNTLTSDGRFLVAVSNQNTVNSVDTSTQKVISSLRLPFATSAAVTPDATTIISVDGNSNVFHVLSMSSTGVITDTGNTVPARFQFWSPNIAMSPNGHVALLANPDGGFVFVLNIDTQHNVTLKNTIPISGSPWGIDFTPDGTKAYVTVPGSDNPGHGQPGNVAVLSIDANNNVVDSNVRIPIPNGVPFDPGSINGPVKGIAIAVDGKAYIANTISLPGNQSTITIVDTRTDTVTGTVTVPAFPTDIGVPK